MWIARRPLDCQAGQGCYSCRASRWRWGELVRIVTIMSIEISHFYLRLILKALRCDDVPSSLQRL